MVRALGFDWRLRDRQKLLSVEDYRRAARRKLPKMVWTYVEGGAEDLNAVHGNRDAFRDWSFIPHVLSGVEAPKLDTTVAGVPLSMPVLLGPTGISGLSRWDGDLAAARAAATAGSRYVISTAASWSIEEITRASDAGHFFQLYPKESQIAARLMTRAWNAGIRVLVLTVDSPVKGNREGERRTGMDVPPRITPLRGIDVARHPRWAADLFAHRRIAGRNITERSDFSAAIESLELQEREFMQACLDWDDMQWIRDKWNGKMLIKGILRQEDATEAVQRGADGIIVSNHGGRQLDYALPTLAALPGVVDAVGDRAEVLIDGGIRRGSDIAKALALGARAVLIARPYLFGLAVNGETGVSHILELLRSELKTIMILLGARSVTELDRSYVVRRLPETRDALRVMHDADVIEQIASRGTGIV